jgi:hypothetical protein
MLPYLLALLASLERHRSTSSQGPWLSSRNDFCGYALLVSSR